MWGGDWKSNNCDFVIKCWVNDENTMKRLASDPEWIQNTALNDDEDNWLDTSKSTVRISYNTTTCLFEDVAMFNLVGKKKDAGAPLVLTG